MLNPQKLMYIETLTARNCIIELYHTISIHLVDNSCRQYGRKIVPLHYVRKQAALVAKCSNKFGISLVCTAFAYRKRGEFLDGRLSFPMTLKRGRWSGKKADFSTA